MSAPGPEGGLDRFCTGGRHWAPDTHDDVVAPAGAAILAPTDRVTACDQQQSPARRPSGGRPGREGPGGAGAFVQITDAYGSPAACNALGYADLAERLAALTAVDAGVPAALAPHLARDQRRARLSGGLPAGGLEFQLLAALALSGWSMRADLVRAVNVRAGLHGRSGTFGAALRRLATSGLWTVGHAAFSRRPVALVRLTGLGQERLTAAGIAAVASEWERIEAVHSGDTARQWPHTSAICVFLHHARARGYATAACPAVDGPGAAAPDAAIARGEPPIFVEVQRRGGRVWRKARKWRHQQALQGFAAICALTPAWARRLAAEAQLAGVLRGCVTDLATLAYGSPSSLWTHVWRGRHSPLECLSADTDLSWNSRL